MRDPDPRTWSRLAERLGIEHPIIQAPMGGGPTTPALVAAVANAGALGSVAGGYLDPERLRAEITAVRELTARPFAVNLFAGGATDGAEDPGPMLALLERWHESLGLPPPEPAAPSADRLTEQVEVLLEAQVDISTVKELMGHADLNTTARYDRRGERAKQEGARRLRIPYGL